MAKLPTSLLARSLPSTSSTLLTTTARPTTLTSRTTFVRNTPHQVRHATEVVRPKRPFTWQQVIQLSDGSTYTVRTTSPQPVYRSTKDTRNHLRWQPSDPSLQNVEVDEAGKLSGFRTRFGTEFDLAPGAALAAKEMREDAARNVQGLRRKQGEGKKNAAAIALLKAAKEKEEESIAAEVVEKEQEELGEDSFASLMSAYVQDQPSLKGGQTAGKGSGRSKKKK